MSNHHVLSRRTVARTLGFAPAILVGLALPGCIVASEPDQETLATATQALGASNSRSVCGSAGPGRARCHALVLTGADGTVQAMGGPAGLNPADLRSAYAVPAGGSGVTVAIVDAYDNPNAEADLAVYRAQFGLPACTTANGCFKKVNQSGNASPLPAGSTDWGGEIALDLDMVSAICPSCKILLVEANSTYLSDLGVAVNTAVRLNAAAVSNSYGHSEGSSDSSYETYYNHPGVLITASSGDAGYGVQYPAASAYALAVGGTNLTKSSSSRGWTETAWSGAGSGCSKYIAKPAHQTDTGCAKRTVADVAAVAGTGVSVYDTYGYTGWLSFGGTSAAAPIVAAAYAASGLASASNGWAYGRRTAFFDVTSGTNGACSPSYLCTGTTGYDGPTGLGTPNGKTMASLGYGVCGIGGTGCGRPVTALHRMTLSCTGALISDETTPPLGGTSFTCNNRFQQQCIDDGTFDAYYMEWCNYGTPTCSAIASKLYACDPGANPGATCSPTKLHRTTYNCNGSLSGAEQVIDLVATGYKNYKCNNRFKEQCVSDHSWDSYSSEWCEYACP
jgi:hypothetical protein